MEMVASTGAPDPYRAVMGLKLSGSSEASMDFNAQYRRRAEILAATRRLLAADGHQKFTIRSVSEACSLTAQTIHNSFGCKVDLLKSALNEHTLMVDSHALRHTRNPATFLMLAIAYYQSAMERPEFMREFMFTTFSPRQPLRDSLMKFGIDLKTQMLNTMARRNLLKPCVNTRIAAEQIAYVNTFGLLEWAENDDLSQLYEKLVLGNGTILLGILVPEKAREIERWLCDPANRQRCSAAPAALLD